MHFFNLLATVQNSATSSFSKKFLTGALSRRSSEKKLFWNVWKIVQSTAVVEYILQSKFAISIFFLVLHFKKPFLKDTISVTTLKTLNDPMESVPTNIRSCHNLLKVNAGKDEPFEL